MAKSKAPPTKTKKKPTKSLEKAEHMMPGMPPKSMKSKGC